MINVKEAAKIAAEYFEDLYADQAYMNTLVHEYLDVDRQIVYEVL